MFKIKKPVIRQAFGVEYDCLGKYGDTLLNASFSVPSNVS